MKAVFKTTGGNEPTPPLKESIAFLSGDYIFREGDLGTEMYIVQEGEVNIVKMLANEQHVLSRLEKGDFFGEMAVLEGAARSADAIAATDVKLLIINGARFDEMIRRTPEIAVRIIRKYSKRLREANHLLEKLAGQGVDPEQPTLDISKPQNEKRSKSRLVDVATGNAFFLSQGDATIIGRADPVTGILPDIDLTTVDTNRSVSRRHAKIVRSGEMLALLEEIGTVNGTFVNDQRIPTGTPVPIQNGDRVRIGLIQMKVVFES